MNRRKFLATLFGAGAAIAAGPALLALVPTPAPLPLPHTVGSFGARPLCVDEQLLIDRYIRPAAQALADRIDADIAADIAAQFYGQVYGQCPAVVTSEAA